MTTTTADASGTWMLGGDLRVNRLGFGAMRLTGQGVWGEPENRDDARRVLRRLPELAVNFIDTADAYGPHVNEDQIREALHPYHNMVIATKGALTRQGPDQWKVVGRPEYLRQCVLMSLRRLGIERIDLWQLHRIDPLVDRDSQFAVMAEMQREGLIRHLGLSEVSIEEIEAANQHFPVVSVQNMYNMVTRQSEAVLDFCGQHHIAFIPWFPLAAGGLSQPGCLLDHLAAKLGSTPSQVALAWILKRSPVMLPIPGTSKLSHLEENIAAAGIELSAEDFTQLDQAGFAEWQRQQVAS